MKAAIVEGVKQAPIYGDFAEPEHEAGEVRIAVRAAALSPLTRGRASGTHYSAEARFPFVAGVDGVGRLDDGRRVYFVLPRAPFGSMAERTVVAGERCVPLPEDLDDVTAAAIANPGMSSWAALTERAHMRPGETVLINGATGTSGRLAVRIARHLGAAKVIATGRNQAVLSSLAADATMAIDGNEDALQDSLSTHFTEGVDVVLDYLWGATARNLLIAAARASRGSTPIRFVQIGASSGAEIALPAAVLRSSALVVMGSGLGSIPLERLMVAIKGVIGAARPAGLSLDVRPVPLAEVGATWPETATGGRIVYTLDAGA